MVNPFTYLPPDACGDTALPDFPLIQDCASYAQLRSEVCGLIIRPPGALSPIAWYTLSEWVDEGKIDNADNGSAHYIVGKGSFLPTETPLVSLAQGRLEENRERVQRLTLNVLNMDDGHTEFGRKCQVNNRNFSFYVVTLGGRVIGGYAGMEPFYTNAVFGFAEGNASRESMQLIIDTEFLSFPSWG